MDITLPNRNGKSDIFEVFSFEESIVIIGANGSGKSRLGIWIEYTNNHLSIHRVSAHRALNVPDYIPLKSLEQSTKKLLWGDETYGSVTSKSTYKWQDKPAIHLQADFDSVLSTLFAKTAKRNEDYVKVCREDISTNKPVLPKSVIEVLIEVWNDILPHVKISLEDNKISVDSNGTTYHGKEMSDGERVALYLIGQCLSVPEGSILIIDEPELHLHKSLMNRLWNKLEIARQDCKFIYITHDLDFASSKLKASKIWVKSYRTNNIWTWDFVPEVEGIPENLVLEIIGNRKNLIFCEGEKNSLDTIIYELAYPNYNIIPRGSGSKVIEGVTAFRNNSTLHHINIFGIVDSDYKEEEEKKALERNGIFTIAVAEIENIFCTEPILRIIAKQLHLDPDSIVNSVTDYIIKALTDEFDTQVSSKSEKIIEYKLRAFSKESHSEKGLVDGLYTTISNIDIPQIYKDTKNLYQIAINERNMERMLLLYNRKNLPDRISPILGLNKGEYVKLLIRILNSDEKSKIVDSLKVYIPIL